MGYSFNFICEQCHTAIKFDSEWIGVKARCPRCGSSKLKPSNKALVAPQTDDRPDAPPIPISIPSFSRPSLFTPLHKYADFSGRASRTEYWHWMLAILLTTNVMGLVYGLAQSFPCTLSLIVLRSGKVILSLWNLIIIIPTWAVTVRRLHDIGLSGLHALWNLFGTSLMVIGGYDLCIHGNIGGFLIAFLPGIVCVLLEFIFTICPSQYGSNKYGPNPHGIGNSRTQPQLY